MVTEVTANKEYWHAARQILVFFCSFVESHFFDYERCTDSLRKYRILPLLFIFTTKNTTVSQLSKWEQKRGNIRKHRLIDFHLNRFTLLYTTYLSRDNDRAVSLDEGSYETRFSEHRFCPHLSILFLQCNPDMFFSSQA
jgi:hypothetical protein